MRCMNVLLFAFLMLLAVHGLASAEETTEESSQRIGSFLRGPDARAP